MPEIDVRESYRLTKKYLAPEGEGQIFRVGPFFAIARRNLMGANFTYETWIPNTLSPLKDELKQTGASVVSFEHLPLWARTGGLPFQGFVLQGIFLLLTHPDLTPKTTTTTTKNLDEYLWNSRNGRSRTKIHADTHNVLQVAMLGTSSPLSAAEWIAQWAAHAHQSGLSRIELKSTYHAYLSTARQLEFIAQS